MAQTIKIQSFDSQIIYNSEESIVPNHGSNSFLNDVLQKVLLEEQSQTRIKREPKQLKVTKIIQKQRKRDEKDHKKTNSKSGKWSGINRLNYYKSILKFSIQHPYYKISWQYWKPEKFYPRMIQQINKNQYFYKKDVIQTKSFDERQRKQYFQKEPFLDMIELAKLKLREAQATDQQARQILSAYQQKSKQKSPHMELLEEIMFKQNERVYEFQDMYCKIMGVNKIKVPEHTSSVFYS